MRKNILLLAIAAILCCAEFLLAQIDARMLRYPDVSQTHITFVYAGDIWIVPKEGGLASRLSSPKGEESFPRFSPDGKHIAFSGNYDGNTDIYVIPTFGGTPERITHHPMGDRMLDWYPDGKSILYASSMESGRQRFSQLYKTSMNGGLPEKLPVPYGEFGTISPDGKILAFTTRSRDFRNWKRYRGGMNPDIWLFDLNTISAQNITKSNTNDGQPMWHGKTLYFMSDRGENQRHNLWAYNTEGGEFRQVTNFDKFDIRFPAIGTKDIVFENGGQLYLLDLATEKYKEVNVEVVIDQAAIKPRMVNVEKRINNAWISPSGKRVAFEARGEIFSVPAKHGVIRNLSNSSGVAERYPAWSPDGKTLAYWSDRSGEYELTVRNADGSGSEQKLTALGAGYRYQPYWSPDSKKLAFVDKEMDIQIYDRDSGKTTKVDKGLFMFHGGLSQFSVSWSSDSRWLAYSRGLNSGSTAIFLFDAKNNQYHQVTSGYYADASPAFDPDGKYLYYFTNRTLRPVYSDLDNSWVYPNTTNIAAVALRKDVTSPLEPRNDEEKAEEDKKKEDEKKSDAKKAGEENGEETEKKAVEIALDGFEQRAVILPLEAGNYTDLFAVSDKVVYRKLPRSGSADKQRPIMYYDLKEREEKTILDDSQGFMLSADGKKILTFNKGKYAIVELKPKQKADKPLRTAELEMQLDPRAEWRQLFADTWRLERDYFYDANMHGVDWQAMREQYGALIEHCETRWDVHYVLGELIAELNASHTYRGGGDTENAERRNVGLLGVDWKLENGAYRIARIIDGAGWDAEVRSPFAEPGVKVQEGDYILAVNGQTIDASKDPWAAFQGLGNKTISLTVNDKPLLDSAREVIVKTLNSETRLRHLAWIEANRKKVDKATNGEAGYIYVRSTGRDGQTELVRQFMAQFTKKALIIDERFNSGGQIPDRFIELLNRPALAYWAVRDGKDWQWPPVAHFGPKVMLINGWSGSGGDAFPDYFKKAGLGPLIGTRTWGGLIGVSGAPGLIDGGGVTVPTFRMYNPDGKWFEEG
ncbi:MAG: PDZ domain-containing protein, partial [bacterium]